MKCVQKAMKSRIRRGGGLMKADHCWRESVDRCECSRECFELGKVRGLHNGSDLGMMESINTHSTDQWFVLTCELQPLSYKKYASVADKSVLNQLYNPQSVSFGI